MFPNGQVVLDGNVSILEVKGFRMETFGPECVGEPAPGDNNEYTITYCYELVKEDR